MENATEFIFMWEIHNFSCDLYKNKDAIDSPVFEVDSFGGSQWCLRLYPCGVDDVSDGWISCYLYKKKNDIYSEESSLNFVLEFIGDNGTSWGKARDGWKVYKLNEHDGFDRYLHRSTVTNGLKQWPGNVLTVRCHMFNASKQKISPNYVARTEVPVNRTSFLWNVKISDISSQRLVTRDLVFLEKSLYDISLNMPDDVVKICISQKEESTLPMFIACKLTLLNSKGKELKSKSSSNSFDTNNKWEFPSFITKADLDPKRDVFSLFCEISSSNGIKSTPDISSESGTTRIESTRTVLKDLKNMLDNHIHSDIKLKAENEVMHAHKSILASRSPVFSAMFEQDMIESKTGVVDIPDLEANILKIFLEFLYTDTIENFDYDRAKKLFVVADKYQVSPLTEKCASFLESRLSLENVTEILSVADLIGHEGLKKFAMNCAAVNSVIIFNTPEWQDLMRENLRLAGEMISVIAAGFKIVPNN